MSFTLDEFYVTIEGTAEILYIHHKDCPGKPDKEIFGYYYHGPRRPNGRIGPLYSAVCVCGKKVPSYAVKRYNTLRKIHEV